MNEDKILIYLRWYVIPFSIFIFILTVFESFYLFLLSIILFLIVYWYFSYKYKNISFFSIIFILASLALGSFFYKKYKFYQNNIYTKTFTKKYYYVDDTYKKWQYILKDDFWWTFLAKNMPYWYKLWDKLKVYWFLVPTKSLKNYSQFKEYFFSKNLHLDKIDTIKNFDYNKFLEMKWINGVIYVKKEFLKWKEQIDIFHNVKQKLVNQLNIIYSWYDDKYKALVLWLLIWDKSYLDQKIYKEFIHSWLVHIIVVSWWNMMFFIIFLSFLLFFLPFYIRLIAIWIFITIYAFVVWNDSSVIRALIMWILSLLALFYGRYTSTSRILWITFIIMLIYNPFFLVYDLGFILSFLAISGILIFNRFQVSLMSENYLPKVINPKRLSIKEFRQVDNLLDKIKFKIILWWIYFRNNYALPTLWASLFTAPAILFFTKQVNILAAFASLVVIPIVPIITFINIMIIIFYNLQISYSYLLCLDKPLLDLVFNMANLFSHKFSCFIKL